jgi:hypothetical protein
VAAQPLRLLQRQLSRLKERLGGSRAPLPPPDLGELLTRPIAPDGTGEIPLAELLAALHSAPERATHALAQRYVGAVRTATLDCLRAQRHLFSGDPAMRGATIERLAESLYDTGNGYWQRFELDKSVVEAVGPELLAALVSATINGSATIGLEGRVYEYLSGTPRPRPANPQAAPLSTLRRRR